MSFLQPLALGLLLLLPIIILLHMLRIRRQRLPVSSTYFWAQAMREIREEPKLRRPPITLLLLLHLLLATLLALALSRPTVQGVLAGGDFHASHTLVVLDASASMQATDVAPSRFEAARSRAQALLDSLDPAASVTLIRMGVTPQILYSGEDLGLARAKLNATGPGGGSANLREAMRLASSLIKPGIRNRIIVLSDLNYTPDQANLSALGEIPAPVEFIPVGSTAANRAITLVAARAIPGSNNRFQLFVRAANFSGEPTSPIVRVLVDGLATIEPRQIRMSPGAQVDLRWDLPPGASRVEVRLTGDDPLPADDVAELVLPAPDTRRIALVSAQPDVLKRALEAIPGTQVLVVPPQSYQPDPSAALTVFENFLPAQLPPGPVLAINPPPNNPFFPSEGQSPDTAITRLQPNSRLLEAVDLSSVTISQAHRIQPAWATEVVGANVGPLIFEGIVQNSPVVVFTFSLADSNLPSRVGFPILIANIVNHLAPEGLPPVVEPGQPVFLRAGPQVASVTIQRPSGPAERFTGSSLITFADTEEWGRYAVTETLANGGPAKERFFTVNAGSDTESDLRTPREPRYTAAPPGQVASGPTRGREIWPLLGLLALGILLVEWWVAHR